MSTRKLAAGALVSLLLSLGAYLVPAGLLSWVYYDVYLTVPGVRFDPSPFAWVVGFWTALAWFLPFLFLWWLAVHFAEVTRQAEAHSRFVPADLWLLLAGLIWLLLHYAKVTRQLPIEFFACGGDGFLATCAGPRRSLFWGVTAVAAVIFLFGLVRRVRGIPRDAELASDDVPELDRYRNGAVVAWLGGTPSEKRLQAYLSQLPDTQRGEAETSARALRAAADALLVKGHKRQARHDLEAQLLADFPWLSESALGSMRPYFRHHAWYAE